MTQADRKHVFKEDGIPEFDYDERDKQDQDNFHVSTMDKQHYMSKLMDYVDMYMMHPRNQSILQD